MVGGAVVKSYQIGCTDALVLFVVLTNVTIFIVIAKEIKWNNTKHETQK